MITSGMRRGRVGPVRPATADPGVLFQPRWKEDKWIQGACAAIYQQEAKGRATRKGNKKTGKNGSTIEMLPEQLCADEVQ